MTPEINWPTMPPSKGQSTVLFEDGYAEGWAKCSEACHAAVEAALLAPQQAEGWVMVPVEPTREMIDAAWDFAGGKHITEAPDPYYAYKTMIAARPSAPQQAEIDAITELNHAQWLALENVRTLAARNRKEEWAQHLLRWCIEAGNAARILRSTPSAPTAVEPDERAEFEAWFFDKYTTPIEKYPAGDYVYLTDRNMWEAWQARASKGRA